MDDPEKVHRGTWREIKEDLIDVIIMTWEGIQVSLVNKFVDLMPERLEDMRNE
jgi:DNA-directed RNA polymerase subunit F